MKRELDKIKEIKVAKSKGISLIVLVITIIVIIILAGAVILSLANNNPVEAANEAVFKSNVGEYNSELSIWVISKYSENLGSFDVNTVNKTGQQAKDEKIISLRDSDTNKFAIQAGKLVYIGSDTKETEWAGEAGVLPSEEGGGGEVGDTTAPNAEIDITLVDEYAYTVEATITLTDSDSGVNVNASKYIITTESSLYATNDSIWNTATALSSNPQSISEGIGDSECFIQVLSVDNDGNKKVTISSSIFVR